MAAWGGGCGHEETPGELVGVAIGGTWAVRTAMTSRFLALATGCVMYGEWVDAKGRSAAAPLLSAAMAPQTLGLPWGL